MNRLTLPSLLAAAAIVATGCASTRVSTTSRTAIEQALLTETAREAIGGLHVPPIESKTFAMQTEGFETVENHFVVSAMKEKVLEAGGRLALGETAPEIGVEPRVNYAQIDDGVFLIGISSVPIPISKEVTISTPEIALWKKETQKGRTKFSAWAIDKSDGSLAFSAETPASVRYYTRWKFLLFFGFKTTNLGKPF